MDPELVKTSLRLISKVYGDILLETHEYIIPAAVEKVGITKENYDWAKRNQTRPGVQPTSWGYTIDHSQPLRFKSKKVPNSIELQVDVYCDIQWKDDDIPIKQDIKVRIWSEHSDTIFNTQRDSEVILEHLTNKNIPYAPRLQQASRVVSRIHFDKADSNPKSGPKPEYHLQFGGIPESYELCWHPEKVNVPRLEYQPVDLFLICQIIAANFFSNEYLEIRKKFEWRQQVLFCQNWLLHGYYRKCLDAIEGNEILLDKLWKFS